MKLKAYFPITKVDDEQRMVYGYASTEALDTAGERIAKAAIEAAMPEYMRFANIREMHQMSAVGVAKSAEIDDKGVYIAAKVVDDAAWEKVKEGVYKGFSVGGKGLKKADGVVTKMRLTEISLVDRPANPECVIDCFKADGADNADEDGEGAEGGTGDASADAAQQSSAAATTVVKIAKGVAIAPEIAKALDDAGVKVVEIEPEMKKGLYSVRQFAELLQGIAYLVADCEFEAQGEGDDSPIPGALREWMKAGLGIMQALTAEEANELAASLDGMVKKKAAGEGDDIAKIGMRFSKVTKGALAKVHGMLRDCDKAMTDMGYESAEEEGTEKAAEGSPLANGVDAEAFEIVKAAGFDVADGAAWADVLKAAIKEVGALRGEVAKLKATPAARKAAQNSAGVTVTKAQDTNGNAVLGAAELDPNDPLAVIKAAHAKPQLFHQLRA